MPEQEMSTEKYQLVSVEKTIPPEGLPGKNWYRYVIGYNNSTIDGTKPGTLQGVTEHAEAIVIDLNIRSKSSRSTYAPKQTQRKKV